MIADALKLSVYFGESVSAGPLPSSDDLIRRLERRGIATAALLRGLEGFGINRRIHAQRFPDVSTDLPLLAMAVDTRRRIEAALDDVDRAVPQGLVTLEHARLASGTDVAGAEFPAGPGRAAKLTIYCGSDERARGRPAYREAVNALRRHGATGAIVLAGVDGLVGGRRRRARLFATNGAPMVIISVGPPELLRRSLPQLAELLPAPLVTLEAIAQVKHDGELLEPPPRPASAAGAGSDVWQTIRVYTRRTADVHGRPLYDELTRRLREAGAAGATTILGDWGFSSDEPPHGDKLGRVASHRPTYSVCIDRPARIAELWPIIDELTIEHGIVTSLFVPGYRERAGDTVHGSLRVAERLARLAATAEQRSEVPALFAGTERWEGAEASGSARWVRALLERIERFARERESRDPVVRITLADGDRFFLYAVEPGPGDELVTLYPHPERYDEMVPSPHGERIPPRALAVPPSSIAKVELMARPPRGTRALLGLHRPPRR
jgi:PII-like signaling protein